MDNINTNKLQPVIKWVGGKRQLIGSIIPRIPEYSTYYEPFIGGGAVWLALQPSRAIVNDYNTELTNLYNVIKLYPDKLLQFLQYHEEHNSSEYYYQIRNLDRDKESYKLLTDTEKAARIIYLNKTCFNGLYRVNSFNEFNVPFGKYKNPNIVNKTAILALHDYLSVSDITILNGDFYDAVKTAGKNDFVYFDPPYVPISESSSFTSYTNNGFSTDDQIRLKNTCDELDSRGVKFLLSNSYCPFILDLYKNYKITTVMARRAVNSNGSKRQGVSEVLLQNYD